MISLKFECIWWLSSVRVVLYANARALFRYISHYLVSSCVLTRVRNFMINYIKVTFELINRCMCVHHFRKNGLSRFYSVSFSFASIFFSILAPHTTVFKPNWIETKRLHARVNRLNEKTLIQINYALTHTHTHSIESLFPLWFFPLHFTFFSNLNVMWFSI